MNKIISIVILTFNEQDNIERVLKKLTMFEEVVVIDSFSSDDTIKIASSFENVTLYQRKFDNHLNQWNYGIEKSSKEWVFSSDADFVLPDELLKEIDLQSKDLSKYDGFYIGFKYCMFGKPLTGNLLAPQLRLFRKSKGQYIQDGHTQRINVTGNIGKLNNKIYHDDRKSLSRWFWSQERYADLECKKLKETKNLSLINKIRKFKFLAPFLVFFYCLFIKGGILDGKAGLMYAYQRMYAELLLSLKLIEEDFNIKLN